MKLVKFIIFSFVFTLIYSCASKKHVQEFDNQPAWVKQKPIISGYYVGIGSAKKVGTKAEYTKVSNKDALTDLAGEVSVKINSSSVLHTIETQNGHTDFFNQRIEVEINDYLEGFEPVDNYENDETYWVYYRINKKTYQELKRKRKDDATANARAKYIAGQEAQNTLNPIGAITYYLQGLSAIRQYLGEENPVTINERKKDIGNSLYSALNQACNSLSLIPLVNEVTVKHGERLKNPLQINVYYNNKPVNGVPVYANYSGGYLNNDISYSNAKGETKFNPGIIHSKNKQEELTVSIDFIDIANKATEDLFIRRLISNKKQESKYIILKISLPKIAIYIEDDLCINNDCRSIVELFEKNVLNYGYLTETAKNADYIFYIQLDYIDGRSSGGITSVNLQGDIELFNTKDELIWGRTFDGIFGVGYSKEDATHKAYNELLDKLNLIYFRQGLEVIQ